jgi:hypothetical protein
MKNFYKYISLSALALSAGLSACHNGDIEFDDYEGGISVYFPRQTPVRTLVMGEDTYNTDLDNAHKCKISTTMGGSYTGKNIEVYVAVDESLLNNIYNQETGEKVESMPKEYYSLSSTTMDFAGSMVGSIEVSLSDAFFEDPKSVAGQYVIPLSIQGVMGADTILSGSYDHEVYSSDPQRTNAEAWRIVPMDYTLFCIDYISKYHGYFMRRITSFNGEDSIHVAELPELPGYPVAVSNYRYQQGTDSIRKYYIRNANEPIVNTQTINLNEVSYVAELNNEKYSLVLNFATGKISAPEDAKYTVDGTCAYKDHSEIKAWGNKDRDGMYLDYTVTSADGISIPVKETLVLQRRGVTVKDFNIVYKE